MSDIGNRIALLIEDKQLKKVQFAKILNIDQSYVTQLIKGRNNPSDRLVEDISQKFEVNKNWLLTGSGEMYLPTKSVFLDDPSLDNTDREILNSYINMTPTQRQFIKDWINHIAAISQNIPEKQSEPKVDWKQKELNDYKQELDAQEKGLSASDTTKEKRA